jgi:uncharacterized protein (TIGR02996 family)
LDDSAFLSQVLAAPSDDAPRLVWADALQEKGDPRGEFIQVQCQLARGAPNRQALQGRARALLNTHERDWSADLVKVYGPVKCVFVRGFIEEVTLPAAKFLKKPAPLLGGTVRRIQLAEVDPKICARLALCEELDRVRELDLRQNRIGVHGMMALAGSKHLAHLELLDLGDTRLGDGGLKALAACDLSGLRALYLWSNGIHDEGIKSLVASASLKKLAKLVLSGNPITEVSVDSLLQAKGLPALREVKLEGTRIPFARVEALREELGRRPATGA